MASVAIRIATDPRTIELARRIIKDPRTKEAMNKLQDMTLAQIRKTCEFKKCEILDTDNTTSKMKKELLLALLALDTYTRKKDAKKLGVDFKNSENLNYSENFSTAERQIIYHRLLLISLVYNIVRNDERSTTFFESANIIANNNANIENLKSIGIKSKTVKKEIIECLMGNPSIVVDEIIDKNIEIFSKLKNDCKHFSKTIDMLVTAQYLKTHPDYNIILKKLKREIRC